MKLNKYKEEFIMEKFNAIKSKFETDFNAIKEKNTEEPEYENIGAIPKKIIGPMPLENKSSSMPKKSLKPPRSTPRQLYTSSTNEYENIEYPKPKPTELNNSLIRATHKKKIKKPRAKPLEILPIINEGFAKLSLALPEPEYANIVPRNPENRYSLSDNMGSQPNLSEKDCYHSEGFTEYEYVIDNSLYLDFFQRTGQSPTQDFFSEVKPLVRNNLQKEDETFSLETNLSIKKPTTFSISNPFISKKVKKIKEKPKSALHSIKDEPIFANITQCNPDGTIEWEAWQSDESNPTQSNLHLNPKRSKFLPKNLNFWLKPSKKNQDILEETNVLEIKKTFPSR